MRIISLLLAIVLFAACDIHQDISQDPQPVSPESSEQDSKPMWRVSEVRDYNDRVTATYKYDKQWRLIYMKHINHTIPGPTAWQSYEFTYLSDYEIKVHRTLSQDWETIEWDYHYIEDPENGTIEIETVFNGDYTTNESYIYDDKGNINRLLDGGVYQCIYDDNRNMTGYRVWEDPNDDIWDSSDGTLQLMEYNDVYRYDGISRPDFGLGKCFFIEPLPSFGDVAPFARAVSQHNMTHYSGEINWEYTYNEDGLPSVITSISSGIQPDTPIECRLKYVCVE